MKKIVLATANQHKVNEINQILDGKIEFIGLDELGFDGEIPEDQLTIEGNAHQKADFIFQKYGLATIAEDTGLFVNALGGEPGVYSARYALKQHSNLSNIDLLLKKLTPFEDRSAYFKTVFCLVTNNGIQYFEGICKGRIINNPSGVGGFGYDPIFTPDGYEITFAEMDALTKNKISHRGIALENFIKSFNLSD